jgi:hypothetical protein
MRERLVAVYTLARTAVRASLAATAAAVAAAAPPPQPTACTAPAYRQFDFWLGDWDVFDAGEQVARVRVSSILAGCVLLEEYGDSKGNEGRSFSIYDATRGLWHQGWVTNGGRLLVIEGRFHDGVMELAGRDRAAAGSPQREVRGTWQPVRGGVREFAARSSDGGQTWQPWFDLLFRPHVH